MLKRLMKPRASVFAFACINACATSSGPLQQGAELLATRPTATQLKKGPLPSSLSAQLQGEAAFAFGATGPILSADETARLAVLYRRLLSPGAEVQLAMTIPGWPVIQLKGQPLATSEWAIGWIAGVSYANIDLGTIGRGKVLRRHQLSVNGALPTTWGPIDYFTASVAPRALVNLSAGDGTRLRIEPSLSTILKAGKNIGAMLEGTLTARRLATLDGALTLSYFQTFE